MSLSRTSGSARRLVSYSRGERDAASGRRADSLWSLLLTVAHAESINPTLLGKREKWRIGVNSKFIRRIS